jgi:GT2 family glycosyltransferase
VKPVPAIPPPPPSDGPRPLWSVMLPTYRPDERYLAETLESVLGQDPGPERMQIAVVDDASPGDVAERVVAAAGGRVELHRSRENGGMARNWNRGVALARGRWVHLLHQDDLVLPGFYRRLGEAVETRPDLGAAYAQHYLIDGRGRRRRLMSQNPAERPGVVDEWLEYVFVQLSFQTPAVVVRREVYEELGGFREDFRYALDWDFWKRVAARYPLWYDPEPLACYRRHASAASMGFFATGGNMEEVRRSIELSREYVPEADREPMAAAAHAHYQRDAIDAAIHALARGAPRAALAQWREAGRFDASASRLARLPGRLLAAARRRLEDG